MASKGTRWLTRLLMIFSGIALSFYLLTLLGGHWADVYLKDMVRQESHGAYSLEYKKLRFHLWAAKVELSDCYLKVDSAVVADLMASSEGKRNYFEVTLPRLVIELKNIRSLIFQRTLTIERVLISRPRFIMHNLPGEKKPVTLTRESGDLYTMISRYLQMFQIESFVIDQAAFGYREYRVGQPQQKTDINDLTFSIQNFLVDSTRQSNNKKLFYTDAIELLIKDQVFYLSDQVHQVGFEEMLLSTDHSEISFKNFKLEPRKDSPVDYENGNYNIYHFDLPEFNLLGVDFSSAYHNNQLQISTIRIKNPHYRSQNQHVSLDDKSKGKGKEKPPNDLSQLIVHFIDQVSVDSFHLEQGSFDMTLKNAERFQVGNVDIHLEGFHLDTAFLHQERFLPDYSAIRLQVSDYRYDLTDSIHTLTFQELGFSTLDSSLHFDSLRFHTNYSQKHLERLSQKGQYQMFDIQVPRLALTGLDLEALLNQRALSLDTFLLVHPLVHFFQHPDLKKPAAPKKAEKIDLENLHALIQPVFESVRIGDFILVGGKLDISRQLSKSDQVLAIEKIDLHLQEIDVRNRSQYRGQLGYSRQIDLSLEGTTVAMANLGHLLKVELMNFSTFSKELRFDKLRLTPLEKKEKDSPESIELLFDQFKVTGVNLKDLLYKGKFDFEAIALKNPSVIINQLTEKVPEEKNTVGKEGKKTLSELATSLSVKKIDVSNLTFELQKKGETRVHVDSGFFSTRNFAADPRQLQQNTLLPILDELKMGFKNLWADIGDSIHVLTIGHQQLSLKDSLGEFSDIRLAPRQGITIPDTVTHYAIHIPQLLLMSYDPRSIAHYKTLDLGKVLIRDASVQLNIFNQPKVQESAKKTDLRDLAFLPENFVRGLIDTLKADLFSLERAHIDLVLQKPSGREQYSIGQLDLALNDFFADKKTPFRDERFLFTQSTDLKLSGVSRVTEKDSSTLGELRFHAPDIGLEGEAISTFIKSSQPDSGNSRPQVSLTLASFSLSGVDLWKYLEEKRLSVKEFTLSRPIVNIEQFAQGPPLQLEAKSHPRDSLIKGFEGREALLSGKADKLQGKRKNSQAREPEEPEAIEPLLPEGYPLDTALFSAVDLGHFILENGEFTYLAHGDTGISTYRVGGLDLEVEDLAMAPEISAVPERPLFSKNISLRMEEIRAPLDKGLQEIKIGAVGFQTRDQSGYIRDLALHPLVDTFAYAPLKGKQTDMITVTCRQIDLQALNLHRLLYERALHLHSLKIDGLDLFVFRDKRIPRPLEGKKELFNTMLIEAKTYIRLDSVYIDNSKITYQEFAEKGTQAGQMVIGKVSARGGGFCNDPEVSQSAHLDFNASLMDASPLHAQLDLNLMDPKGDFSFNAQLGPLDMTKFNTFAIPTMFVRVDGGQVDSMRLVSRANDQYAVGEMEFYYKDLHITYLGAKNPEQVSLANAFTGLLANTLVKSSNQPVPFRKQRYVYFERLQDRSQINYLIKIVLSGLVSNVGVKSHRKQIRKLQDESMKQNLEEILEEEGLN